LVVDGGHFGDGLVAGVVRELVAKFGQEGLYFEVVDGFDKDRVGLVIVLELNRKNA
jgi:hypothetical protein